MQSATHEDITIINFGMGSPMAATIMDLLFAINPKAVQFLGKFGGLKSHNQLSDLILPIAAIRGDGASDDYLPPEVPALPSFRLQRAAGSRIEEYKERLNLTDEQFEQIREIRKKYQPEIKTIREDESKSREDKRTDLSEIAASRGGK